MEYYERILELLALVKDRKETEAEYGEIKKLFLEESGKEISLIMSEFLVSYKFSFDGFMHLLPLFSILFSRLATANKYITNEYIEYLFGISSNFSEKENEEIYKFLIHTDTMGEGTVPQPFLMYLLLVCSDVDEKIAKDVRRPEDSFGSLPHVVQIALARSAVFNTDEMKVYGLERLAELLLMEKRAKYQESGVLLAQKITSPSSPIKLFKMIATAAPFLSTMEVAQQAWKLALGFLHKMNDEDRFHAIRLTLEDSSLAETARSALTAELQREISKNKAGIFRSPHVTTILGLIVIPNIISAPVANIECFMTVFNFLQFFISIDKKYRCFQCMGTPQQKFIMDSIEIAKKGILQSKNNTQKPKEDILKTMKKSNFGENMTLEDVKKSVESSKLSIKRAEFALKSLEDVLQI